MQRGGLGAEQFREQDGIDVRVLHEVEAIDAARRRVHVRDLKTGRSAWKPYDQLLIATGASPICPDLPGSDAVNICGVNTLESGLDIHRRLDKGGMKKGIVVVGGYIGLEMAEALVRNGLQVSLVDRGSEVMGTLDEDMGALVSQALRESHLEVNATTPESFAKLVA